MQATLRRVRAERATDDRGFTLIELLVVVVIIGVLVAIAIPLYLNYRKGAENKSVQADMRSAITALEQYYTDNGNAYPATASVSQTGNVLTLGAGQTVNVSSGNSVSYSLNTGGGSYRLCATNSDTAKFFAYNSDPTSTNHATIVTSAQTSLAACLTNVN